MNAQKYLIERLGVRAQKKRVLNYTKCLWHASRVFSFSKKKKSDASLHEANYLAAHLLRVGFEQEVRKNRRNIYSVCAAERGKVPHLLGCTFARKNWQHTHAPGGEPCVLLLFGCVKKASNYLSTAKQQWEIPPDWEYERATSALFSQRLSQAQNNPCYICLRGARSARRQKDRRAACSSTPWSSLAARHLQSPPATVLKTANLHFFS